jgi:dihydroorotase
MNEFYIINALLVNEGRCFKGGLHIANGKIKQLLAPDFDLETITSSKIIDAGGKILMPGVIDDQVHFREPGLTYKGEIFTESRAAIAGGITSFMEMPNTNPQTLTIDLLEEKFSRAAEVSPANFSFYLGASNDNISEIRKVDPSKICGIKVFMGASTGNMLVDNEDTLAAIFAESPTLVAVHAEDEPSIRELTQKYKEEYGENIPIDKHHLIRSAEACYKSSCKAVELANRYNTRLHVLHLSTAKEMSLFSNTIPLIQKRITAEVCVHHLWFSEEDYQSRGSYIKWNPAIKRITDRDALLKALLDDTLDVVATDHAPHTFSEKQNPYLSCPSGGPLVQHSLTVMLQLFHQKKISLEKIVEKMCHAPADLFRIDKRGYLREGYWADLVLVDLNQAWEVNKSNILYKCGWSPFEGMHFDSQITHTFVNGNLVFENGQILDSAPGMRLIFKP